MIWVEFPDCVVKKAINQRVMMAIDVLMNLAAPVPGVAEA
jgi:hypothetical protein